MLKTDTRRSIFFFLFFLVQLFTSDCLKAQCGFTIKLDGPLYLCPDGTYQYTATVSPPGAYKYAWNTGDTTNQAKLHVGPNSTFAWVQVTVTDDNGCTQVKILKPHVMHLLLGGSPGCIGQEGHLSASLFLPPPTDTFSLTWSTGTLVSGATYPGPAWIEPITQGGIYSVTVVDETIGCTLSASATVADFYPIPDVNIEGIPYSCPNETTYLNLTPSPPGSAMSWAPSLPINNGVTPVTAPGTYYLTVVEPEHHCKTMVSYTLSPGAPAVPALHAIEPCPEEEWVVSVTPSFSAYQWSDGSSEPTLSLPAIDGGPINVTVTNEFNCHGTAYIFLTPVLTTHVNINGLSSACPGSPVNLSATGGFAQYLWSTGDTLFHTPVTGPGTYSVTATNAKGCTATNEFTIDPLPPLSPTITPGPCANNGVPLQVGGGNFTQYAWSTGASAASISANQPGTFVLTVTNALGCTGTASLVVPPEAFPQPAIAALPNNCSGTLTLAAGSGFAAYAWSSGDSTSTFTTLNGGTYTVTVTDAGGCTAVVSKNISIPAPPSVAIAGGGSVCPGEMAALSAGGGFAAYAWSTGDTLAGISVLPGAYFVTVTDGLGCTATASASVGLLPVPTVAISAPALICPGDTAIFQASGNYAGIVWSDGNSTAFLLATQPDTYTATVTSAQGCTSSTAQALDFYPAPSASVTDQINACQGSATLSASAGFAAYQWSDGSAVPAITVSVPGSYSVTATDAHGCTAIASGQIAAFPPLPQAAIVGPSSICTGSTAQLSATGGAFAQYQWSTGANTASIAAAQNGNYGLTVTDAYGCTATALHALSVSTSLSTQIASTPYACDGQIHLAAEPGFSSYLWSSGETGSSISVGNNGAYSVTVSDASGCTGSTATSVMIPASPAPNILGPVQICPGGTAQLSVNQNFTAYAWSTGSIQSSIAVNQNGNFSVTVTDVNGCTAEAIHPLNFGTTLMIDLDAAPYACDGQIVLSPGQGFAAYQWSTGATSAAISAQSNGDYSVTVVDATGCTGEAGITVLLPLPPQTSVSGPAQVCAGSTALLQAGGNFPFYHWSNGDMTPTITASQGGIYSVTITDAIGCTASASAQLSVLPSVQASVAGPAGICPGGIVQLNAMGGPFSQYHWSTGSAASTISVVQDGLYGLTVTDADGCTASADHTLVSGALPEPQISAAPYACDGQIAFSANAGFSAYSWSNGATTLSTAAQSSGVFTVTVTNAAGCTGTAVQAILVPASPQVSVSGPAPLCFGATGQLVASSGFSSYLWPGGETTSSVMVSQSGNYAVTATDGNGCTASAEVQVEILPPVQAGVSGPALVCAGTGAQLQASPGFIQYLWSNGAVTPEIFTLNEGMYSVTLTDANGCSGTAEHILDIAPLPQPDIMVEPYACDGKVTFGAEPGYAGYSWSNGTTAPTFTTSNDGSFTVTVTDENGCTNTATQSISLPPPPAVSISGPEQLCAGEIAQLTASGSGGGSTPPQFAWSNGQTVAGISVSQSGNYTVTLTDGLGCTDVSAQSVFVHQPSLQFFEQVSCFPQDTGMVVQQLLTAFGCDSVITTHTALSPPVFATVQVTSDFNGLALPCHGATQGKALASASGGVAPYVFQWSNGASAPALEGLAAGTYSITVSDANGCTAAGSIALNGPPPLVPEISVEPALCFAPGEIHISGIAGGAAPFNLTCAGETRISDGMTNVQFGGLSPGNYQVQLTDANGCTAEKALQVQAPAASSSLVFVDSMWAYPGMVLTLHAPPGHENALSIAWSPPVGLSCTDCPVAKATVGEENVNYTVVLNGYGHCEVQGRYSIRVRPRIYVPNVILPGSAENGVFTVYSRENGAIVKLLRIYTRWGELVKELRDFEVNGPKGWEGDFRGQPVTPGVYVFYAEVLLADGRTELLKGDVTVVR